MEEYEGKENIFEIGAYRPIISNTTLVWLSQIFHKIKLIYKDIQIQFIVILNNTFKAKTQRRMT